MSFSSGTTPPTPVVSRRGALITAAGGIGLASVASSATAANGTRFRARTVAARRRRRPRRPRPAVNPATNLTAVRVFPSYRTKVYGQHDAVLERLGDLGIKRMSHKLTPAIASSAAVISFTQRAYFEHGIKSWLTVGEPRVPISPAEWDKMVRVLKGPLAGMVERVYGWNEPNHVRGGGSPLPADWHLKAAAHQAQLWARMAPLGIKVGTPQLWSGDFDRHDRDLFKLAPHIRGNFDHIGWHLYPRGTVGEHLLDRFEDTYRAALGGTFPVVCTEAGYFTAPNYRGGAINVTEAQEADYLPKLVDSYVKRGYGISYFELLNDPDPSGANREAHLGLFNTPSMNPASWTPKAGYHSLKAHLAGN
ncbi:hypothetical protein ENKNEFLB_00782 [Nocardioides aquaticus]|uniref:Asl1-like glycosyl hydrolase catalytic domain-containing protein n=1 Tax=Nocardioides aquaticus TaxID=160826 RepID=A0ABX8EDA3_9ACTN|nr:hypothetical protein ENKNEFLB_00782 [Nocardioides aquaticus]